MIKKIDLKCIRCKLENPLLYPSGKKRTICLNCGMSLILEKSKKDTQNIDSSYRFDNEDMGRNFIDF